jgi:transcriptional regulator with XRE-family HTH domain
MAEFLELGTYLKEKRISEELTQAELAGKLGDVHTQFVSNWERGLCAPPGHCFTKLISVLHLNREKLVKVMLSDSKKVIQTKILGAAAAEKARKKRIG